MNVQSLKRDKIIDNNRIIFILIIASVICTFLGFLPYFIRYSYIRKKYFVEYYKMSFCVFDTAQILVEICNLAPCAILVVYLTRFRNNYKAGILIPICFGLVAFVPLLAFAYSSYSGSLYPLYLKYEYLIGDRSLYAQYIYLIHKLAIIGLFSFITYDALKGLENKRMLQATTLVGCALELWILIRFLINITGQDFLGGKVVLWFMPIRYVEYIGVYMHITGKILLYIGLYLFGMNNRIPTFLYTRVYSKKRGAFLSNPECELKRLGDMLKFGAITNEEYEEKRKTIIKNL